MRNVANSNAKGGLGRLEVRYKIEIKTSLSNYEGDFFAVTRSYDEFEWLLEIMVPEN